MGALDLYTLTLARGPARDRAGRDTIVIAFGAVEQHGHHLPMGTDSIFGDELGRALAERLDAFHAPTMPSRLLAAPPRLPRHDVDRGGDVPRDGRATSCSGWAGHGFKRIVLLPTHGGNFAPAGGAIERLDGPIEASKWSPSPISACSSTPRSALGAELGVPVEEGGLHGGEWETSMMLALHPELVHMDRAVAGYKGDLAERAGAVPRRRASHALTDTGVFGDPANASAEHGRVYLDRLIDLAVEEIERSRASRPVAMNRM